MRVLSIVHQRDAAEGVFREPVEAAGVLERWLVAEEDSPPGPLESYDALLIFGGSMNVDDDDKLAWLAPEREAIATMLARGIPTLGICLGSQLLAQVAGGDARRARESEIGWRRVEVLPEGESDPLLGPLAPSFDAFEWHRYEILPPPGSIVLARSPVCVQAYRLEGPAWGLQFHAEVSAEDAIKWASERADGIDADEIGVEPAELEAQTRERIGAWNELGRALCERFLALVTDSLVGA